MDALKLEVEGLRKPEDANGNPLIDTNGLPSEYVDEVVAAVNVSVMAPLIRYRK